MHIELDDVYEVWTTSLWQTQVGKLLILASIMGALGLCYALFKLIKYYRIQSTKDRALYGLRALKQKIERTEEDPRHVYQRLTDIIKMYAQWRFGLAHGLSDYELMTALGSFQKDLKKEEGLQRIMGQAQVIKFGLAGAQRAQMKEDIETVIAFIATTEQEAKKRGFFEV